MCSRSASFNIRVELEPSLSKPSPSLLTKRFAHLTPLGRSSMLRDDGYVAGLYLRGDRRGSAGLVCSPSPGSDLWSDTTSCRE
jgi:hypothetical protein